MVDVAIVGGGVAGSALAILLGRRGFSVELFERGQFPKEKACGEGIMPGGVAALQRLGLAEAVGGRPFNGVRYHFGGLVAEGRFPRVDGLPAAGWSQRRRHLDNVDSPDRKLARESPHSLEKLSTRKPPRFRRTGTGKIVRQKVNRRHLLEHKASKRTRRLDGRTTVSANDTKRVNTLLNG